MQTHLLQAILDNMADAVIVADRDMRILVANATAARMFRMPPLEQCIGQKALPELFSVATYIPDEELPLARAIRGEEANDVEMRLRDLQDGKEWWISVNGRPLRDEKGEIQGGIVLVRDISLKRRTLRRQAAQYAVAEVLASSNELESTGKKVLEVLCETLNFPHGSLWIFNPREKLLQVQSVWQRPDLKTPEFLAMTRRISLLAGMGLPGQALSKNAPQFLKSSETAPAPYPLATVACREGLRGVYAFPIEANGEAIGVIEFFSAEFVEPDPSVIAMMQAVGSQIGQTLARIRAQKALSDSEALYQSLVESLPQNIFRKDRQGRITYGNERYCRALNSSLTDLLGKTDFDLFPPALAAKYVRDDDEVIATGQTFDTIEAHHRKNGSTIFVQVIKTPVFDAQGQIVGTQGIFWDVTEKKLAQEKLSESERRYRQLTEGMLDGIAVLDPARLIVLFNPAAERMFGYRAEEILGQPIDLLVPAEYRDGTGVHVQSILESGQQTSIPRELMARRKEGSLFPVELGLSQISFGGAGEVDHLLGAFRDLTERNKIRSILVQSEKLASIGMLSAGMAHEINNPLAFVANNLFVLERDCANLIELVNLLHGMRERLPGEELSAVEAKSVEIDLDYIRGNMPRILNRTREGVDRVSKIVQSLRGLARTDTQRRQDTPLLPLIDGSLEILAGRVKKAGITVEQTGEMSLRVNCAATQIGQLMLNLLINAVQAIESCRKEEGMIGIRAISQGQELLLEVSDNGCGISPENMPHIFDPFFTTKDVGEGTGLGLSICHNIVTAHDGRIEVESEPGRGATFRVYLPLSS